ncbi:NADP-dependent oxidoreductase domain-containing protein [Neohortaea acidophila]|uniref:NADP-dependent oxidoreductase domain-containing protein n=1 Tax=Neohortaea acidophila TaxID=245834 RepID=A0A6A6PV78_9PEZI|nr:NADP-dependent oxidoreductase domain-containing protein [Neohortaea acidophila]KAF2484020.1 NADP-dependent oxidoreductase domain-containing protein [Neohortaea acidophila]
MPLITGTGKPRVILGCMTFGPKEGARITSLDTYNQALDFFQGQGYSEIDTARNYNDGAQEGFTREANWQSRGLTCATKCYPNEPGNHSPDQLEASLEKSLKELGTDCVDIFYLHAADRSIPFTEPLKKLNELHKKGKFVRLGLSNFTAFEVAEVVMHCKYNNWVRPTIYQGMYNAITRSLEQELIPTCRRYGLDVVVYNPIAAGLLAGRYKTKDVPQEGRFSGESKVGQNYRARYFKDETFDALRLVEEAADKSGISMLDIALRWLVHHSALNIKDGGNDGIIIGMSSIQQLEQNLKGLEGGPLPEEVLKKLDEAWLITKPNTANYWHLKLEYTYDTQKALFAAT